MTEILKTIYNSDISNRRKIVFWILVGLFMYLSSGWIRDAYWAYWPFKVAEIHSFDITNPDRTVYPGGIVQQRVCFSKYMKIQPIVYTELKNAVLLTMAPVYPPEKDLGEGLIATPALEMPAFAPPGMYVMTKTWVYPIGPNGRAERITRTTSPFYVLARQK